METFHLWVPDPPRRAQPWQTLGHDHCVHRLPLSVCMTLNTFATLAEVNVDSMVNYLGQQNEMVVFVDPEANDATTASVGGSGSPPPPGVSSVQYMSKEDTLNAYRGFLSDYASLLDEFENDNPFKANYRVSLSDLSQMSAISQQFQTIPGVYSVSARRWR